MAETQERAIQALTRDLGAALGDNLVSLMLYGSAARGEHVAGRSDLNALIVVRDTSAAALRRAAPALQAWIRVAQAAPLIQSEADWAASADVFPIEIGEIQDAHRLLAGRDVVSGLATSRADVRRQLEHDVRGRLIRLRAEYAAEGDSRRLGELLARATGTFLVLFRAALRLAGRPVPKDATAVVQGAGDLAGFAPSAFDWALAARRSAKAPSLKPDDTVAASYLAAIERFAGWVDKQ